ncbi:hypothetical protein QIS99_31260 [Streptomyces sp. B-S-A8]|uniref:ATP-dependent DNA ligase family profile domain-containing protein n=1 Tax=Streptomyces solicavernae TaxID=3043614 RepID=A0ABT6S446_9ACTN|nr:hypothetical protein [Streptomyces sp. B-S-A8]MDI3390641.1 hypothetical protein [Streptomyces sp. B-S-A8]
MEYPIDVALARAVPRLPEGSGWWFEPKFDGHRLVLWRDADSVRCQARSGRTVTAAWMDLAVAGMDALRPGTVLDGEAVMWIGGRLDFSAVQARAASTPRRAADLARQYPAHFAVFDCLALEGEDLRARPYVERRAALLDVLADVPPPIQAVPATDDRDVALAWYEQLPAQGIEGIVAKRATSPYPGGRRSWVKVRHADTEDAVVVGYLGPPTRPSKVVVRLGDGARVVSQTLSAPVSAAVARHIAASGPGRRARTPDGVAYVTTGQGLVVEVLAGTTRHVVLTVVRVR